MRPKEGPGQRRETEAAAAGPGRGPEPSWIPAVACRSTLWVWDEARKLMVWATPKEGWASPMPGIGPHTGTG